MRGDLEAAQHLDSDALNSLGSHPISKRPVLDVNSASSAVGVGFYNVKGESFQGLRVASIVQGAAAPVPACLCDEANCFARRT